ncbi:hypothetical protein [Lignipirellula cremea]|uniref:Uncharacterized protein n=1 Tax=Lignipirellula cremea TaxID=2528010 RepID=A0A518DV93_9BACT|nr:hypothetical protein [Lignipirellula cremea]QDU95744.1 hypothetical protein Pla8534_35610 [Lignipirellula cremea]
MTNSPHPGSNFLSVCPNCSNDLPLRLPVLREIGIEWLCARCGMTFYAVLQPDCSSELRTHVRPAAMEFDPKPFLNPPPGRATVLSRIIQERYHPADGSSRPLQSWPIPAMPLDDQFRVAGEPFTAMSLHICMAEVCLAHTRHVPTEHLAIELASAGGEQVQTVVRVLSSRAVGLFYEVRCQFLTRMGNRRNHENETA